MAKTISVIKTFIKDMLCTNGKFSLARVLTIAWFGLLMAYGIKFLINYGKAIPQGTQINISEPTFLMVVFGTLVVYCFANKTNLNIRTKTTEKTDGNTNT